MKPASRSRSLMPKSKLIIIKLEAHAIVLKLLSTDSKQLDDTYCALAHTQVKTKTSSLTIQLQHVFLLFLL